jgi:hypothetical protein
LSVEQMDVVDALGVDEATDVAILLISDHLDWADITGHLSLLQGKINAYLSFIESGEIVTSYPSANGRKLAIELFFQHEPPAEVGRFLEAVRSALGNLGIGFWDRRLSRG